MDKKDMMVMTMVMTKMKSGGEGVWWGADREQPAAPTGLFLLSLQPSQQPDKHHDDDADGDDDNDDDDDYHLSPLALSPSQYRNLRMLDWFPPLIKHYKVHDDDYDDDDHIHEKW